MADAQWANQERTLVFYWDEEVNKETILPTDPRLEGVDIAEPDPPTRRAEWANVEKTLVLYFDEEGGRFVIQRNDLRLNDLDVQDMHVDDRMVAVPLSVTRFQAQYVMRQSTMPSGKSMLTEIRELLEGAAAQASALPESDPIRREADLNLLAFNAANTFERSSDMIRNIASLLNLDDNQIDRLFVEAGAVAR